MQHYFLPQLSCTLTSSALYSSYVATQLVASVPKCHMSLSELKINKYVGILPIQSPCIFSQTENHAYSFASSEHRLKNAFILRTF